MSVCLLLLLNPQQLLLLFMLHIQAAKGHHATQQCQYGGNNAACGWSISQPEIAIAAAGRFHGSE